MLEFVSQAAKQKTADCTNLRRQIHENMKKLAKYQVRL